MITANFPQIVNNFPPFHAGNQPLNAELGNAGNGGFAVANPQLLNGELAVANPQPVDGEPAAADPQLLNEELAVANPQLLNEELAVANPQLLNEELAVANPQLLNGELAVANPQPVDGERVVPRGVGTVNMETHLIPAKAIVKKYPKTKIERVEVASYFKAGDIIFTTQKVFFLSLSSCLQFLFKLLRIQWPFGETQYSHAAIVVKVDQDQGRVLVADVVRTKGSTPRVYDILTNFYSRLGFTSTYKVLRSRDVTLHQKVDGQESFLGSVAAVAERMGEMNQYLIKQMGLGVKIKKKIRDIGFGYKEGLKAIVYGPRKEVNLGLKIQLFQQIYDEHVKSTVSMSGSNPRKFFCSYFVAYILQQVEAYRAFIEMTNTKAGADLLLSLNTLIGKVRDNTNDAEKSHLIHQWVIESAAGHGEKLCQKMKRFKFNAETMAPGALEVQLENDYSFQEVLHIRG